MLCDKISVVHTTSFFMVEEWMCYNLIPHHTPFLILTLHNSAMFPTPPTITVKLFELCPFHPTFFNQLLWSLETREKQRTAHKIWLWLGREIPLLANVLLVAVGLRSGRAFHRLLMSLVGCVMLASRGVEEMVLVANLVYWRVTL